MTDYDALVARLLKFCKVADSCLECAIDRAEAAAAIRELRAEVESLNYTPKERKMEGQNPVPIYELKADDANRWIDLARNGKVDTILLQEQQIVALCSAALQWIEYRDRVPSRLLLPTREATESAAADMKQRESLAGHWAERSTHWQDRAERAEAERDALRAAIDKGYREGFPTRDEFDAALAKGEP